jgi:hypothetical protein
VGVALLAPSKDPQDLVTGQQASGARAAWVMVRRRRQLGIDAIKQVPCGSPRVGGQQVGGESLA